MNFFAKVQLFFDNYYIFAPDKKNRSSVELVPYIICIMDKTDNKEKLQIFATEDFKELELEKGLRFRYAISNFGRLVSFSDKIEFGRIVNGSITEGYRIFRYRIPSDNKTLYRHKCFHRLVAENFLERTSDEQIFVIHVDHNLANDVVTNLKWATKQEMLAHHKKNPKVRKARKKTIKRLIEYNRKREGQKLSIQQVIQIKKLITDPNRKTPLKKMAKQFGISEMHLYRIKSGKNWGRINIDEQDSSAHADKPAAKKTEQEQKPKKAPEKIREAWIVKLEAYRNGEKGEPINKWIRENRKRYKEGKLQEEKIEKLKGVNFPFEAAPKIRKSKGWDRLLEEWKKGNWKSSQMQLWKQKSVRRFLDGKLSKEKIEKLKEVGILK